MRRQPRQRGIVRVQQLDPIRTLVAEDKEMPRERVDLELLADQLGQGVERLAQVGGPASPAEPGRAQDQLQRPIGCFARPPFSWGTT